MKDSPAVSYDEWVSRERERLTALHEERMARLLELLLVESRWRETIEWAEKWIAQGRAPEPAYRALMHAHANQGNSAAALTAFQRCIDALERELGVPPSAETMALAASIRNLQFTIHPFDRLRTPHSPFSPPVPPIRSNLPAATTPLIGRETELTHLTPLLTDPAHRLVTILGPGGMGKSRLALAAGHASLENFPDGVFLVELTALSSADEMPRAIGESIGYPFQNDPRPPRQQLLDYLRGRKLLLLLDNFEHLLDGAELLIALLQAAPGLHLLVTSRERLRLHAEKLFRLEGLAFPSKSVAPSAPETYGAAHLFVESVRRLRHNFAPGGEEWDPIYRVCRLVDGSPLGLLLAAAWSEVLSPQEIGDEIERTLDFLGAELADLPPRHRHIRSILEFSWQQLRPDEQSALMKLSVFAGSISRQAAGDVAQASISILSRLLDLALIAQASAGRYTLHEVVRQLASEKLDESLQTENICQVLTSHFCALLVQQTDRLVSPQVLQAVKAIETDWPNIRLALQVLVADQNAEAMVGILASLARFFNRPGWWQEGAATFGWMAEGLQGRTDRLTGKLAAYLLAWQGVLTRSAGIPDRGEALLQDSLDRLDGLAAAGENVAAERAFALLHRHTPLVVGQERRNGKKNYEESLRLFRSVGDRWGEATALQHLSYVTGMAESLPAAQGLAEESLAIYERLNDPVGRAKMLTQLSFVHNYQARTEKALELALAAQQIAGECGALDAADDNRLAVAMMHSGRFSEALDICLESIRAIEQMGIETEMLAWRYNTVGRISLHLGQYETARLQAQRANQLFVSLRKRQHPFFLRTIGLAFLAEGNYAAAAEELSYNLSWQADVDDTNQLPQASARVDQSYHSYLTGQPAEGARHLAQALGIGKRYGTYLTTLRLLPIAALIAQERGHPHLAYDLAALAHRYPYIRESCWFAAVAGKKWEVILAPTVASRTDSPTYTEEARGRTMGLPEMTAELLALLA